jgi:predicted ArsR family transcriptional regulator
MEFSMATTATSEPGAGEQFAPGLGDTQRGLLLILKRRGPATQAEVGQELDFAPATLREHLQALNARGLVERRGTRRGKRGRPEVVYALTSSAEALFPRREAETLRALATYLIDHGQFQLVDEFFSARVAARRPAALARVRGLRGADRFTEVARILSEQGFMAQVTTARAEPTLRLCHCPISALVEVTHAPCRYEQELIGDLLGRPLHRTEYLPDGQGSCSYADQQRPLPDTPFSSTLESP